EDEVFLVEEQPLLTATSPTAQSPDYVPESDPEVDLEEDDDEDPKEDPADDDEEEEHPAHADFMVVALPAADQAPPTEETEPFETDESADTPPPYLHQYDTFSTTTPDTISITTSITTTTSIITSTCVISITTC
ncbi:hypothetical protein Tco_0176313, partial [Tanacetum coccineum]